MGRVEGKVAVITGGASGIGLAAARLLAAEGASVVVGDLHQEQAESAASAIVSDGGRALGVAVDAMDEFSLTSLVQTAVDEFGALHVICNHVGGSNPRLDLDLLRLDLDEFDRVMRLNVRSTVVGCRDAGMPGCRAAGLPGGPAAPDGRRWGFDHQHRVRRELVRRSPAGGVRDR